MSKTIKNLLVQPLAATIGDAQDIDNTRLHSVLFMEQGKIVLHTTLNNLEVGKTALEEALVSAKEKLQWSEIPTVELVKFETEIALILSIHNKLSDLPDNYRICISRVDYFFNLISALASKTGIHNADIFSETIPFDINYNGVDAVLLKRGSITIPYNNPVIDCDLIALAAHLQESANEGLDILQCTYHEIGAMYNDLAKEVINPINPLPIEFTIKMMSTNDAKLLPVMYNFDSWYQVIIGLENFDFEENNFLKLETNDVAEAKATKEDTADKTIKYMCTNLSDSGLKQTKISVSYVLS